MFCGCPGQRCPAYRGIIRREKGGRDEHFGHAQRRDLRTLAGIVSDHRADLPPDGLPLSLLAELMSQVRCDLIAFHGYDSELQQTLFLQHLPGGEDLVVEEDYNALHWKHYWNCQPCSYPDRTGDLRSIVKVTDFYSARQWHSTGMYCDMFRPWDTSTS